MLDFGVHTPWHQQETVCPPVATPFYHVEPDLSSGEGRGPLACGCWKIVGPLPSAPQKPRQGWGPEEPPLGKGGGRPGVAPGSRVCSLTAQGLLILERSGQGAQGVKDDKDTMVSLAPLLAKAEGAFVSWFYKPKGQFIDLQWQREPPGALLLRASAEGGNG